VDSESVHDVLQGSVFVEDGNTNLSQTHRFGESLEVGDRISS